MYPKVAEMLYRSVTQAVILFVSDTWVVSVAMEIIAEKNHTGFLRQITGKWERRKADKTWSTPEVKQVWEASEIESDTT